jgi:arabinogalactan oligomer/maltooligosaccharide transport system permease protein
MMPRTANNQFTIWYLVKILLLGVVGGLAIYAAFPLIDKKSWLYLALLIVATAAIFFIYLSPRRIPAKYLIPGTLFLLCFQLFPVLYTVSTAFTNFGDAHRGTKQDAITAIQGASVKQVAGSQVYKLSVATTGSVTSGPLVFLLTDTTKKSFAGTKDGLKELSAADVQQNAVGRVTSAKGYTVLTVAQEIARSKDLALFSVPTDKGAIRSQGLSQAFEGAAQQVYDKGCDCVTDRATGQKWKADNSNGLFKGSGGELAQGWKVNVGLRNFKTVLTDQTVRKYFFSILLWNLLFAVLVVTLTFAFGLLVAMVFNHPNLRGQKIYRSLLILPYAMPAFAMLLVWRDMFNTDFGLVNHLFGLHVDWFGNKWSARAAVILIQVWMGYPYMFLVCTGALQAIPQDLTEAAQVDGAKPRYAFRTITFPLLLVAVGPLLVASFAFNMNNFNAIFLTTEGGPFPASSPDAGGTDLLITYTYRLAFGGSGAQYGLAAATTVFIFLIVAVISVIGFRQTRALEEIN